MSTWKGFFKDRKFKAGDTQPLALQGPHNLMTVLLDGLLCRCGFSSFASKCLLFMASPERSGVLLGDFLLCYHILPMLAKGH